MTTIDPSPDRADFIAGLHVLADLLTDDDTMPLLWHGSVVAMIVYVRDGDTNGLAQYADVMTDKRVEVKDEGIPRMRLRLHGKIGGVRLEVVGDPATLPKVVTGTRVVEDVDYDTSSLLADPVATCPA